MSRRRIILLGKDIEIRFVSLVKKAEDVCEEVVLFDYGSEDGTVELAEKLSISSIQFDNRPLANEIAKKICELEMFEKNIIIHITSSFRLKDLPMLINRSNEDWDVHMSLLSGTLVIDDPINVPFSDVKFQHLCLSSKGLHSLSELESAQSSQDLPGHLSVRVLHPNPATEINQRQSLTSASRFAQWFYWVIHTRHPLLLFGIPGFVLFFVGYQLSGDVLDSFNELNKSSLGFTLAVVAVTLIGLFAMMVGLILYIMGKQVKQFKAQYEDATSD